MSVRLRIKVFRFRQLSTRVAITSLLCRRSGLPGHSTPQELAHAFFAEPLGAVDDQLAAQEDLFDPATDRAPFQPAGDPPTLTLAAAACSWHPRASNHRICIPDHARSRSPTLP